MPDDAFVSIKKSLFFCHCVFMFLCYALNFFRFLWKRENYTEQRTQCQTFALCSLH